MPLHRRRVRRRGRAARGESRSRDGLLRAPDRTKHVAELNTDEAASLKETTPTVETRKRVATTQLEQLEVEANPLRSPPMDVCRDGVDALKSYFARRLAARQRLARRLGATHQHDGHAALDEASRKGAAEALRAARNERRTSYTAALSFQSLDARPSQETRRPAL